MANSLLTIDMVTQQMLVELKNRLVLGRLVDRQWDDQVDDPKIGGSIRIRRPVYYTSTPGPDITGDILDTVQRNATLTLDQNPVVPLQFTQNELTLSMTNFAQRILAPAADRIAQEVESAIATEAMNKFAFVTGTPGTPPSTSGSVGDASAILSNAGVPFSDRWGAYAPDAAIDISDSLKTLFSQPIARDALTDSKMGRLHRIDMHESQSIGRHTNGTFTTLATPLINGAGQETDYETDGSDWQQSLITDGWNASLSTVTEGDHFTIDTVESVNRATNQGTGNSQQFVVLAAGTSVTGDLTLSISPPIITEGAYQTVSINTGVTVLPDGLALTFIGTEDEVVTQNIVAHQNAITIGFAQLAPPAGGQKFSRQSLDNITMSITSDYDILTANNIWRVETLFGVTAQNPMMGVLHTG